MKKIQFLFLLLVTGISSAYGQRYTDLRIAQQSPKLGDTITAND